MKYKTKLNHVLEKIFETGETVDAEGQKRVINDMISRNEALALLTMIRQANATVTLEVGLAHGASALVFCQALTELNNPDHIHYAVDPNQYTTYKRAACMAVEKAGYIDILNVLAGPSHLEIPKLIEKSVKLDCAFIDGWHTFDYTLIDFFLVDKLLKPGGYLAFHDTYGRAKQKVINFILTHRKYQIRADMMNFGKEPFIKTIKFFIWRIYKDPMLIFSSYHWRFQIKNSSGLIILQKTEEYEPNYDFFKNF